MKTIIDYTVVSACDLSEMTLFVREKLKKGWVPFGNFSIFTPNKDMNWVDTYYQPMVKYKED